MDPDKRILDREQNLLLGVLAVQLRMITPAQFAEAAHAWTLEPARCLADHLLDAKALTKEQRALLRRFVTEAIAHHDGEATVTLSFFGGEDQVGRMLSGALEPTKLAELTGTLAIPQHVADFDTNDVVALEEVPGRYSQVGEHTRGGMGRILLVHDEYLDRDVALKELLSTGSDGDSMVGDLSPVHHSAAMVGRFLREAKVTGQLEHPSIVPVYELGRRPNGAVYYTMKLVRGQTLAKALKEGVSLQERLRFLPHFVDLCYAIAYAHSRGVIHRDIKPSNVMVGEFGETVVIDWGLAKARGHEHADMAEADQGTDAASPRNTDPSLTQDGVPIGTPVFMPPEQAQGDAEAIDERSDIYSLGAVLYVILTGRAPFSGGTTRTIIDQVKSTPPEPVSAIEPAAPPELVAVCERAMQKAPEARYPTVKEIAEELERFQSGALIKGYRYSVAQVLRHYYRSHRAVINVVAASLLVLLAGGVYSYVNIMRARDRAEIAQELAEQETYVSQIRLAQAHADEYRNAMANETLWATGEGRRNWEWGYLLNRCNPEVFTLTPDRWACYSPDGALLVTLSKTEPPKVRSADTGAVMVALDARPEFLNPMAFSPDGSRLVAPDQRVARVWETGTGKLAAVLTGHTDNVNTAVFGPNGKRILTASNDRTARIWDPETGEELARLTGNAGAVYSASFSTDGTLIVTSAADYVSKVWDVASASERFRVNGGMAHFNADGTRIMTLLDGCATIWDSTSGKSVNVIGSSAKPLWTFGFAPDGKRIVTTSKEGVAELWHADTGKELQAYEHGERLSKAVLNADGSLLMTWSLTGILRVWNTESGENTVTQHTAQRTITTAQFSPDSTRVVTASLNDMVKVWDVRASLVHPLETKHRSPVTAVACSPDGQRLATISEGGELKILDAQSGEEIVVFTTYARLPGPTVALDATGRRAVAVLDSFTPMVFDLETREASAMFTGHDGTVMALAFSPDGAKVVSGSWDNTARVWDASTGDEILCLKGHSDSVEDVRFAKDGRRVLTASDDGTARVWDATSGAELMTLQGHAAAVKCAAFDADQSRIVTASHDGTAKVWDAQTGTVLTTLTGHSRGFSQAAFSPDGKRIVTVSQDASVWIWAADSDKVLARLTGQTSPAAAQAIRAAQFLPNGRCLLTAGRDGSARIWEAAPWQAKDCPGESGTPWRERYALYRKTRLDAPPNASPKEPAPLVLITTAEVARDRLTRLQGVLQGVLQGEDGTHGEAQDTADGVLVDKGSRLNALARLCFIDGDRIVSLNGMDTPTVSALLQAVDRYLAQSGASEEAGLTMVLVRKGRPLTVTARFQPRPTRRQTITLSRKQALAMMEMERKMITENSNAVLKVTRTNLAGIGEPIVGPRALNGVWVLSTQNPAKKEFYHTLKMTPGERVTRFNGAPVMNIDALIESYSRIINALEAGEDVTLDYVTERGEFQHIETVIRVE
jgi:eukaryotic-like serine/threonine-protein kinase